MKIRKQLQKQADELLVTAAAAAAALLEPPAEDKKAARLFSTEACTSPHGEAGGGAPTLQQLQEDESNSGSCGDWTLHGPGPDDLHNNVRRKYARRSLRSAGPNGYSNGKPAVVAQVIQRRSTPRGSGGKVGHPSEEPEGSLLHCLYLQLLAAGSEGMTLKEIFASFASQTRFSSLGSNWREQVKSYLTSNPAFKGVKARYFLMSQEIDQKSESASPDPSEGVQTRRKAYERTIEAVLNESVAEFQKAQKVEDDVDEGDDEEELSTASMTSSEDIPATPPRKRKSSSPIVEIQEPMDFRHTGAVPGSLKAMQARIVAETGGLLQSGARCSRKDGSNHHSKWQCPMMAMEGKSLCQHHNFLSERKKARYKRAKRIAAGKPSSPPPRQSQKPPQIIQDLNKPPRDESPPPPPPPPVTQRVPRTRSDAQSLAESANMSITEPDMDSETEVRKSRSVNPSTILEPAGRQSFRSTRKPRLYLAAKKTAEKTPVVAAAPGKSMKKQSVPLIRPPSIPPLPMLYGVRRKSMKNRPPSQLSL